MHIEISQHLDVPGPQRILQALPVISIFLIGLNTNPGCYVHPIAHGIKDVESLTPGKACQDGKKPFCT